MKISVIHPNELGPAERASWCRIQNLDPSLSNPFLSPEFTLAVGHARRDARLAILHESDGRIGFFPYERHPLGIGKAIGWWLSFCQGLVHSEGLEWDPHALLRSCGLGVWEFNFLLASQKPFVPFHATVGGSRVMDLSDGYDAYLASRRPTTRRLVKSTLYQRRRLEHEVGPVRFEFDVLDLAELRRLMSWKSNQYRRIGRADRFGKRWVVRVVDELAAAREPGCTGTLSMLYAGDEPVAGHFGLRSENVLNLWFPAYDPRFSRYSPGRITLLHLAEAAAAVGLVQIDMGRSAFPYKESFKSYELPVAEGYVERPSAGALLRRPARSVRKAIRDSPTLYRIADRALRLITRTTSQRPDAGAAEGRDV